jgi:hypothetical protein
MTKKDSVAATSKKDSVLRRGVGEQGATAATQTRHRAHRVTFDDFGLLPANASVHQRLTGLFDARVATGFGRLTAAFAQHAAQFQCEAL